MKRKSKGPVRKYTLLTAKSAALCLINRPDPLAQLCPYLADEPESNGSGLLTSLKNRRKAAQFCLDSREMSHPGASKTLIRKDPKSFSQNLFGLVNFDGMSRSDQPGSQNAPGQQAPVESLSNLSPSILDALLMLHSRKIYEHPTTQTQQTTNKEFQEGIRDYINQSLFYTFGDISTVLRLASYYFPVAPGQSDADGEEELPQFYLILPDFVRSYTNVILDCLWDVLRVVFVKPRALSKQKKPTLEYISDEQAASLVALCIFALTASADVQQLEDQYLDENEGIHFPNFLPVHDETATWHAERFANRLAQAVYARNCFRLAMHRMSGERPEPSLFAMSMLPLEQWTLALQRYAEQFPDGSMNVQMHRMPARLLLRYSKLLFVQGWDGSTVVQRSSLAGCHLEMLNSLYRQRQLLSVPDEYFPIGSVSDGLDPSQIPLEWPFDHNPKSIHLLHYPFLFRGPKLIACFRAINLSNMTETFVAARAAASLPKYALVPLADPQTERLNRSMLTTHNPHLVLEVHRGCELDEALDQLWNRDAEELCRPLKIRYLGEEGFDVGGPSQEFLNAVFTAALSPDHGMFDIIESSKFSWFRPISYEPSYRFEMLGVLAFLAVHNGFVLPISFPDAFYHKLCDVPVNSLADIQDGWPDLAKSLQQMLDWDEAKGDVEDVIMTDYVFTVDAGDVKINVQIDKFDDSQPWPDKHLAREYGYSQNNPPPLQHSSWVAPRDKHIERVDDEGNRRLPSPQTVNNRNKDKFVADYTQFLVYKSIARQFGAFAKGFFTCLQKQTLKILSPELLRMLLEGTREVDVDVLERATSYDGFDRSHPLIKGFWKIVRAYNEEQKRKLLEFVTASDRMPVRAPQEILFVLQKNGPDTEVIFLSFPISFNPFANTQAW
ncbi:MAG: hypothetical protein M1821_004048 [Bathelium mastoideum]|nr:MAG: hypothetical protein M1821_004048 [Bathelium mastoideum]